MPLPALPSEAQAIELALEAEHVLLRPRHAGVRRGVRWRRRRQKAEALLPPDVELGVEPALSLHLAASALLLGHLPWEKTIRARYRFVRQTLVFDFGPQTQSMLFYLIKNG